MSLLPDSASFEELVQECFLAHRGAGLMLSPLDAELVGMWATQQVPFEVVARGIRRAAERALFDARPGEPLLRTLRSCRRSVEAEIKQHQGLAAGRGSAPGKAVRRRREALAEVARQSPALARAVERIEREVLTRPQVNEELVPALLLRALPFEQRRAVWRAA